MGFKFTPALVTTIFFGLKRQEQLIDCTPLFLKSQIKRLFRTDYFYFFEYLAASNGVFSMIQMLI